jgi:hypothetical protein
VSIVDANTIRPKDARDLSNDRVPCSLNTIGAQDGRDIVRSYLGQIDDAEADVPGGLQVATFGNDIALEEKSIELINVA